MDPVLPPTLFDVLDLLASMPRPVTLDDLNVRRRVTFKRFYELGRVLESFRVAHRDGVTLIPDKGLKDFVQCWEKANLDCINQFFRRDQSYDKFLRFLEAERTIEVPNKGDSKARQRLGAELKEKAGLTFVAVDTFKWWALCVGKVYLSHTEGKKIYWGGGSPNLCLFEQSILSHYIQIKPKDGFANVGQLADRVCRELYISFTHFEGLFRKLYFERPGRYMAGTSLARLSTTKTLVQTLLPRSVAKQLASSLRPGISMEWTEKRRIEDGIVIGKRSVKMVKIQSEVAK